MRPTWRDQCRPIIARVLAETAGQPEAVIKEVLREAYPFGERANHPYKIWLSEIRVQRFGKPERRKGKRPVVSMKGQREMF